MNPVWFMIAYGLPTSLASGAQRDLSQFVTAEVPFTVTITLDVPMGTVVAGAEEMPPAGWTITSISNGGSVDPKTGEVKWGPFFDPSIPSLVTYDATTPDLAGEFCFTGTVSFDGPAEPITGDECIGVGLPAVSTWGLVVLSLLILCFGTRIAVRGRVSTNHGM